MSQNIGCLCPSYSFRPGVDVLSGRGECFKRNNLFYRTLVADFFPAYNECRGNRDKRSIGAEIVAIVHSNGGRFLDINGNELPEHLALHKTMKALKDRRMKRKSAFVSPSSTPPSSTRCSLPSSALREHEECALNPSPFPLSHVQVPHAQSTYKNTSFDYAANLMPKKDGDDQEAAMVVPTSLSRLYSTQAKAFHAFNTAPAMPLFPKRVESGTLWDGKLDLLLCCYDDPFDEKCEEQLLAEVLASHSTCICQSCLPDLF
mmetsp:Transcript_19500/g.39582  ORF Transcript_19500/g.39582 Transcript_19500/m.39582 type:complete len:260 (+) Transcript_19500:231-1010(+)